MKTMKCIDLGGACQESFSANTFEELAKLSKAHGEKMYEIQDPAHMEAMKKIFTDMQNPDAMKQWILAKKEEFENLPED